MNEDRAWIGWGCGGALFGLSLITAATMRPHSGQGAGAIALIGGAVSFFIAGFASFGVGVLERTRGVLSGLAWTGGFVGAAVFLVFAGQLTAWLRSPTVTTSTSSTPSFNALVSILILPAALGLLGFLGLFLQHTFLRVSFGDRARLPWLGPLGAGAMFAVAGPLAIVVTGFLVDGLPHVMFTAFVVFAIVGFGGACAIGSVIRRLL